MACVYVYKGHQFNSEMEFDDFLIESKRFESTLGDMVFDLTKDQQPVIDKIEKISRETAFLNEKKKEWRRKGKYEYGPDGEIAIREDPYVGVTKFLSGFTNEKGELLFPEFRDEEYWSRRFKKWVKGDYTNPDGTLNEVEIEEFGIDVNNPKSIPAEECEKRMKQIKRRWEIQAKSGTAVHNVLEICFLKTDGEYNFKLSNDELLKIVKSNIDKENIKYLPNDAAIIQIINHAKKILLDLVKRYKGNLVYYPEFDIAQETNQAQSKTLFGTIDLLVIDSEGKVHILDYKTSTHGYYEFSSAKQTAYSYLLATYLQILKKHGINTYGGDLLISPIQLTGFNKNGEDYSFEGISAPEEFVTINTTFNTEKMWENIEGFMSAPTTFNINGKEINTNTSEWMSLCFPSYSSSRTIDKEYVIKFLKKNHKLEKDKNGMFTFYKYGKEPPITSDDETDFIDKVTKYMLRQPERRLSLTGQIKGELKRAIKNGIRNAEFPTPSDFRISQDGDVDWLKYTLSKYCDGNWHVEDDELLESYGIIKLRTNEINGVPDQIDFVRISTNDLHQHYRRFIKSESELKNRRGLTSRFESDVQALSKDRSMMAEAVQGNVELMETAAILSQLTNLQGAVIGNIQIVNPVYASGVGMSNELLLYCFNELNKFKPLKNNAILSGHVQFAKKAELALLQLNHIMIAGENNEWNDEYKYFKGFKNSVPNYDQFKNSKKEDQLRALQKLYTELQRNTGFRNRTSKIRTSQRDLTSIPIAFNNALLYAIALLKGVDFKQQLRDHDKWLESVFIWRNGVSGSYLDNPGNLNSETLNLVTSLVTEAYQNTRDELQKEKIKVLELVRAVRKEANFNNVKAIVANLVNLYLDMYRVTPDGDLLFVNPNTLTGAKRELLEYALDKINQNRFKLDSEALQKMKEEGDIRYYRVPLALGSSDSVAATEDLMAMFKAKLNNLRPKVAWERALKKVQGLYDAMCEQEEREEEKKSEELFKMNNMFDWGEGEHRLDKIKAEGVENLEHNLETLLLKHIFAYSVQENMDLVFPLIKSAMVHITAEGGMKNLPFTDDILYLEEYIKNKILNKSIVNPKNEKWVKLASVIKQAASKLTLAFAPVQMFYQPLQSLWLNISLMIRKPDGTNAFTFSHFRKAYSIAYKDLAHFSDTPTLCSALNELYGMNDMDMNNYIDRISTAKKGIWNFENFCFKFASRPDYYNRMTIFLSQMMGDGCLEAHSLNSKGELVYNWEKDSRFSEFARNPKGNTPTINKQRSLYYAVASQFVTEHAKDSKGNPFVLDMNNPKPLPRAYTTKLAESMKSLADDIYGYYSHEKKSLIMSTSIGSLWLQFKTYWSGKKNQYLLSGGVRLKGNWKHYKERDIGYYYQLDKDGNPLYNEPPIPDKKPYENYTGLIADTPEKQLAPVMQWEGQWQEGIMLTLSDMARSMWDHKSFIKGFQEKWNEKDDKLRLAYRSNIKLFGYDLIMFAIVGSILGALLGDWLDDLKNKNKKNRDFVDGLSIAAANVAVMSIKNSFLDLNFIQSIGSPIGQWTPFAFEWGTRTVSNWWNVVTGDEDFWDGVVKTSGGLKQIKPALDTLKPDMFRTEREGGTFGKD